MTATITNVRTRFRFPLGARVRTPDGPGRIVARYKPYAIPMPYDVELDSGGMMAYHEDDVRWAPVVGLGATMHYVTDSVALVITRVTAKTVTTMQVETEAPAPDMASDEGAYGLRPTNATGILDRPIPGTERRWTLTQRGAYVSQGQRLTLGYSVSRRDWRD